MIITLLVIAVIGLYIYKSSIKDGDIENEESEQRGSSITKRKKTNFQERNKSMVRMANNMGISVEEVKEDYISDLEKNNIGTDFKAQIIEDLEFGKIEESKVFGIKPENTGSALMREWFIEYISAKENQKIDEEVEEILKERNLIPCSAHDKKKYEMRMQLEERMENSVIEVCKTNPMINTPLAVIAITEAIGIVSENYKKNLIEGKDEIGLNEFEITVLIEEAKKKIFNNLIEHKI